MSKVAKKVRFTSPHPRIWLVSHGRPSDTSAKDGIWSFAIEGTERHPIKERLYRFPRTPTSYTEVHSKTYIPGNIQVAAFEVSSNQPADIYVTFGLDPKPRSTADPGSDPKNEDDPRRVFQSAVLLGSFPPLAYEWGRNLFHAILQDAFDKLLPVYHSTCDNQEMAVNTHEWVYHAVKKLKHTHGFYWNTSYGLGELQHISIGNLVMMLDE